MVHVVLRAFQRILKLVGLCEGGNEREEGVSGWEEDRREGYKWMILPLGEPEA